MFLQLYDKNHNKIAGLAVAKAATVESVLSTGDGTLSFLYPLKEAAQLFNEAYVRTKIDEYIIKEVQPDSSDLWCSVKATLNVEDLEGICWPRFESVEQKIDDCLKLAIAGTGWAIGSCTVTRRRTIRKTECSGWDIIQQARKTYRCEIWFDTIEKKIHIAEKRGQDKGMYFTDTLNLRKLAIQSTSYDFCTRIKAEGKDGLTFKEINGGKDYVENHQYSNKVLTKYWKDERYTNAQSLLEDTTAKLNELSKPVVAYSGDVLDLAKASPKTYRILDFGLGDTVELVDSTTGTKEKQRIVKIVEYPDEPEKNTCEFANRTASFEELQQEQNEVNSTVNNITSDDGTISPSALDLDAITIHVQNIYAQELNAVKARIGELETTTLKATEAIINTAKIEELLAGKATILDLTALTARVEVAEIKVGYVDTLVSDVADIKTLVNGNLTSVNIQAGGITSDSLTIRNGFITNAMIGSVEAGKITTGILNTSLVTVQGADGRMAIKDNTIQIKDTNRVRVQIGKDAAGDYSMYVWDASGALMFDAAGLHAPGIKSGIIRNDMVADNAGIAGTKIDIVSLITSINGNTTKIDSTVIKMDSSGQTLNLAFNTLKTTAETAKSTTETHTTQINAINGKIDTLIQDTTIIKDGQTVKLKDEYNKTVATVGGIQTTIGNQQTTIANLTNDLNNLSIGGRNYILNTAFLKGTEGFLPNQSVVLSIIKEGEKDVLKGVSSQASSTPGIKFFINLDEGGKYLFSFIGKGVNTTGYVISLYNEQVTERIDTKEYTVNTASFSRSNTLLNVPKAGRYCIIMFWVADGTEKGLLIQGSSLKLEKGNKPTDWTPASEDVQGQIAEVKTQQATFEQNFNGFKTTVSNTYATKTDFNNLSVGGRNLLKDTVSYASWTLGNCNKTLGQSDPYGGNKAVLISGNTQANSYILKNGQVLYKKGYHTLSVWLKGTKAGQVYVSFNNGGSRNMNAGKLCNLTTEWQRFEITENTTTLNTAYAFVLGGWSSWTDLSLGVYMAFPMLTEGNKAMPWTPAPEDVDASITAVDSKFASYSTTSQMNSAIDQKANQITQTVSQTYTTKADFNNLSVGGRNLFRCSGNFTTIADLNSMWSSSGGGISINNSTTYLGKPTIQTTVGTGITGIWYELEPDTEYTYSIMVKASAAFTGSAVTPIHYWAGANQANEGKISILKHDTSYTTADVGKFKKLYIVFKLVNGGKWFKPYIYFGSSQSITFYIANLKLEKGQKATDWTPAPEDVDASITAVDSKLANYSTTTQMNSAIDQKANQITQTVSQTYTTKTEFSNLQIGVRNILRNSGGSSANANYNTRNYETSSLKPNTKYTFVINGFTSAATQQIGVWFNGGSAGGFRLPATTTAKTQYIVVTTPASLTTTQVSIYNYPSGSTRCVINWAAMYEGDIRPPMDWTPAKEDTDAYIDGLTTRMSTAEQKITPTAITNAVTSAINGGQASFQTASMTLTSTGLTVDASKFIVRYGGVDLMKLEAANSQLSLRATLQQYNKSTGYKGVEVVDNKIQFYDHTLNGNFVGGISSVVKSTTQDQPGLSIYYDEPDRLGLGYKRTSDGKIIHSMELRNKTININEVTNFSTTVYFNGPGPWMPDVHGKGGFALTLYSNQYIVCRQEANNSIYIPIWAGGFNTGSSRATKDNIVPIQDGSSIIRRSEICSYNLKADLQQGNYIKKYGLIAEDAPDEVVTQDRKAIDLYSMVSIGWKATQEIILENDLRDAKIEHLQREIGELKSKIWQLEQRLSVA